MLKNVHAPWHKISWDRFVQDGLPTLLSERLPLAGYQVEPGEDYTCALKVMLPGKDGEVEIVYQNVPQPDEDGLFKVEGCYKVVVPFPTEVDLVKADILCGGEQLLDYLAKRLGDAPENFTWNETLAREWLPLDGFGSFC